MRDPGNKDIRLKNEKGVRKQIFMKDPAKKL